MLKGDCSICIHLGQVNKKGASICAKCIEGSLWELPFVEPVVSAPEVEVVKPVRVKGKKVARTA